MTAQTPSAPQHQKLTIAKNGKKLSTTCILIRASAYGYLSTKHGDNSRLLKSLNGQRIRPSRLVNPASGGNHYTCGDILDLHNYPGPNLYLYDPIRATVLGEYGGIGMALKGHLWLADKNWGYVKFNTPEEVTNEYIKYADHLLELIEKGFSAAVYTQITDVEEEVNGLVTYDRKVIKVDEPKIKAINQKICNSLNK